VGVVTVTPNTKYEVSGVTDNHSLVAKLVIDMHSRKDDLKLKLWLSIVDHESSKSKAGAVV
jgi:hypothetical protein